MQIENGARVALVSPPFIADANGGVHCDTATVIDADPNATMVSVQVEGEPFFRRIPAWMLQVID
jgi:hypothetical protein